MGINKFSNFCSKNIDCGYLLELPRWGSSNEYPQSMFWAEIWKISAFLSENFQFLVVKFSIYLNRHVFVMAFLHISIFFQKEVYTKQERICSHGEQILSFSCKPPFRKDRNTILTVAYPEIMCMSLKSQPWIPWKVRIWTVKTAQIYTLVWTCAIRCLPTETNFMMTRHK